MGKEEEMKINPFTRPPHSLGHTHTGKTILELGGNILEFRAIHLKWSPGDHQEACQILLEKRKKEVDEANRGYLEILALIHKEEGKRKKFTLTSRS